MIAAAWPAFAGFAWPLALLALPLPWLVRRLLPPARPNVEAGFRPLTSDEWDKWVDLDLAAYAGQDRRYTRTFVEGRARQEKRLVDAGLRTLPGTAAEILDDEVRWVLTKGKLPASEWIDIVTTAHEVGLRSNVTIMFGAGEHPRHWARHLVRTRELQKETGGFTEFVPLPFVHMAAPIYLQRKARRGPTFREALLVHAVGRIAYDGLIPNNVGLSSDQRVKAALEKWHPGYIDWWHDMGPEGFQQALVYLRTAVSVDPKGWAKFDYVKMPDYRWGILLAPQVEDRKIPFGTHKGEAAWQEVPGEYRAMLRRLIVIQGDTEPASVEQQRFLGKTAPSLYDMRNLFQVNVEEGRHLWAMVYLLQKYFGADGREEAEALLQRRSGHEDTPRMLGAFNEETPDWLSFFMFTFFTDRDGKMQLEALAQSGFDPLSRTCRFMLTEEAHHMFVGESGVSRVIQRTCEAMTEAGVTDAYDIGRVRDLGVIDLPTIQKKANLHYSLTLDLFGSEISTNAANAASSPSEIA